MPESCGATGSPLRARRASSRASETLSSPGAPALGWRRSTVRGEPITRASPLRVNAPRSYETTKRPASRRSLPKALSMAMSVSVPEITTGSSARSGMCLRLRGKSMRRSALPFTGAGSRSSPVRLLNIFVCSIETRASAPPPRRRPIWATTESGAIFGITKDPSAIERVRLSGIRRSAVTLRIVVVCPVMVPVTRPLVRGGASGATARVASETVKSMRTALSGIGSPRVAAASSGPLMSTVMSTVSAMPERRLSTR
ncbi:hypothetical protein CFIICLFH_5013 [Methylobacterium goesingense]|nr:hypothetical protein CFIICLFH_5013 [Methylobacterium goesingense]